jgi:hypothetical protein
MRVAISIIACVAAFTLTACFEGLKEIRATPGRLDLPDLLEPPGLQVLRDLQERTFRSSSIQRMAPARALMRLL